MRNILVILLFLFSNALFSLNVNDSLTLIKSKKEHNENYENIIETNIYEDRLRFLDANSPMDLSYNEKVRPFIDRYLGVNKSLISRMLSLKELYFPMFEQQLDIYRLPLEFKYLAIVESALNPKARSYSGATGLWQFMYSTGKEYGLDVTSYVDDRQDPLKSTIAACKYFINLYEVFGDWNLVLAAYNGGPGYLQRKINSIGSYDFWHLHPYLRTETRNYIPTFIAINYVMNHASDHNISADITNVSFTKLDTIKLKKQVSLNTIAKILCVNKQTLNYLNPSFKKDFFPKNSTLLLPDFAVNDFLDNEEANYLFIDAVDSKEILINEELIYYRVVKGDYLGRIARAYGVRVFEIKKWNNLLNTDLDIGDKLILYINTDKMKSLKNTNLRQKEYVVQQGDTLWDIAQKHEGLSIWKIKSLNNMDGDLLIPGTKIILPKT